MRADGEADKRPRESGCNLKVIGWPSKRGIRGWARRQEDNRRVVLARRGVRVWWHAPRAWRVASACTHSVRELPDKSDSVVVQDAGGCVGQVVGGTLWATRSCSCLSREKMKTF